MIINNFDPVALEIFSLEIRWYSLAYIAGILFGWLIAKKLFLKNSEINKNFDDYITYLIIGIILGGRIGYVLFYNFEFYINNLLDILKVWEGGMSFHGGVIGIVITSIVFAKKNNQNTFLYLDIVALVAPIGIFFGRIANFINSELYGTITNLPWAVTFIQIDNQSRHPSQIYEALLEGLLLFVFLNFIIKATEKVGRHSAYFLIGYGIARSIAEIFRTPDLVWGNDFLLFSFITQGQLLSVPMIVLGLIILLRK